MATFQLKFNHPGGRRIAEAALRGALLLGVACAFPNAWGQDNSTPGPGENSSVSSNQEWNMHVQSTFVGQANAPFYAQYTGASSLTPGADFRDTVSVDVMGGVHLWHGAAFYGDVLIWQGYGLSNTLGMAGFPNGEAFRVGKTYPDSSVARAFIRQTFGLGGGKQPVEDDALTLRGSQDVRRLVFTFGRFGAKDIFDGNAYANDPRSQFMNWSLEANDAWDYPANTLGFTNGATLELFTRQWEGRLGIFQVSKDPNGLRMDWNLENAWSTAAELVRHYAVRRHPGALRLLTYNTRAHMGNYQDTIDDPSLNEDIDLTAAYRHKYGFGINMEQEFRANLGAFLRLGWSDGKNQTYEFTDVDRTATTGISVKGAWWRRPNDTLGVALVVNGISAVHREYLAAGGLGITVGDGALDYRSERVLETYYNWRIAKRFQLSPDYQFAENPAYNHVRGPVNLFAMRLHYEY